MYVIVRKDYLRATNRNAVNKLVSKPNVDIWYKSNVVSVSKETCTQRFGEVQFSHDMHWIRMDTGDECGASAIFSCIGYDVNEIPVLGEGKVWRCGDCIEKHHQVAVAVGSGAKVALDILGRS